jgi:hypothetical protein
MEEESERMRKGRVVTNLKLLQDHRLQNMEPNLWRNTHPNSPREYMLHFNKNY